MRTIYPRIRSFGLCSYRPLRVLPLTTAHRRQRQEWCRQCQHWKAEWQHVVFSGESRFCLGMSDGRRMVRRRCGERREIDFAVERHIYHTRAVIVWGAIGYGSRSPLVFICGNMTGALYIDDVLQSGLLPYIEDLQNVLFQQHNARPHIVHKTTQFLEDAGVDILPWSPRSADLNPIEHVWDMMTIKKFTEPSTDCGSTSTGNSTCLERITPSRH